MALQHPLGSVRIAQVPEQDDGGGIIGGSGHELRGAVGIPRNGSDGLPVIVERQRRLLRLQIPDGDEPAGATGSQDMSHLQIPGDAFEVIGASGGGAQTEGIFGIVDVVDEEFALGAGSGKDLGPQWVELERLDSSGVLGGSGY